MSAVQTLAVAPPTSMQLQAPVDPYIHMIERVLRDPSIPMERLDKMLDVQERVMRQRAQEAFNVAFSKMQPEIPVIAEKGQHGGTGKTYAKWDDVIETIMPVLGKHGFSLRSRSRQAEGKIYLTSILAHVDGHSEETTVELGADKSGQKNDVQAIGSSFSYGQRYGAKLLLSLSSRVTGTPTDDNGAAAGSETIMADQIDALHDLMKKRGCPQDNFMKWLKKANVDRIEDIPVTIYGRCIEAINAYQGKRT